MAEKFVAEGAAVLISGRYENALKECAKKIGCQYLTLDVQDTPSLDAFISNADRMLEGANCLVNNAGISLHEPSFFDVTPETFDSQIATNLRGGFFLTQSFTKLLLREKRKGNVLFVSSETGETADIRPYGFTKAALNSLVQGLACLFVSNGIRVNAVAPGLVMTEMVAKNWEQRKERYLQTIPLYRIAQPEEIASVVVFLSSAKAGYITGSTLDVTGGMMMR